MNLNQIYRDFGERVSGQRKALGLTQAQLSSKLGISRASLANIERGGQKVLLHQVFAMANVLGLPPVDLLPGRGSAIQADVLMSGDLNEKQRAQILSLIADARPPAGTKEENDAASTVTRPKAKRTRSR